MIEALVEPPLRHPRGWPCRLAVWGSLELHHGSLLADGTHLVSIDSDEDPTVQSAYPERQLLLELDDVSDAADAAAPTLDHLHSLIGFVDRLPADAALVIRCPRGVSRSTALALGLLAREVDPLRAAFLLHRLRPFACPNALLVRLWDELLGLEGELAEVASYFPTFNWQHGDGRAGRRAQSEKDGGRFSPNAARPSRTSPPLRLAR